MSGQYHLKLIEPGETIIFDKRHSLWEIWKNFIIGAGSIVALILLLTRFRPGPSEETNWGYIILISAMALFFVSWYGAWPLFKGRNLPERKAFVPISAMALSAGAWGALMWFRNDAGFERVWTTVAWVAFFVVILGWLAYPIVSWLFAHFVLTDRRVILSTGVINKSTMSIPLEQVTNIRSSQNAWERTFRYGDVVVETASEYGQQLFTNIGRPLEVKKQIFEQREILEATQETKHSKEMAREMAAVIHPGASDAPPAAAAGEAGIVEHLERLSQLHGSGALSDNEFQRAKEELLRKKE